MISENTKQLAQEIRNKVIQNGVSYQCLSDLLSVAVYAFEVEQDAKWALKVTNYIKECCVYGIQSGIDVLQMDELYWKSMKTEAPYWFESFLIYMEKNRRPEKKFYEPRKMTLHVVVEDLQELEDGLLDFYGLSLPPRVGKSTLCIFFLAWIIGKRPESHNAMSGHSGILADRFYADTMKLVLNDEYTFEEIFPRTNLASKSAEKNELSFSATESFATLTCRGIDGTWTGAVDISSDGYLYVDDMIRDRTESLSPSRLEGRYQDYLNVLVDRKNDGTRELMVGTRWNILDPLGRVEKQYKNNPRYRFRKIPALNEQGESNFVYEYGKGFSTEYYLKIKERLDKNEWEAKYQQRPFVREGLLFPESELSTYNGVLPPESSLVRVFAACDVAWGGGDSLSMPFGYEYEDGYIYIPDWIFNKGDKTITQPIVVGKTLLHKPQSEHFEANNGGSEYADKIDEELQKQGYKCSISSSKAPNTMSKLAKIIQYAPDVKRRCKFLEASKRNEEYHDAMDELTMFVQIGKNVHDDAADGVTQLMMAASSSGIKTEIVDSPI